MKILALLTGRGGSKLENKNIIKINGKPCIYYPCRASKAVKGINNFFVTSDDIKILKIAKKYGFEIIKRPKKLSRSNSKHLDVLKHALNNFKEKVREIQGYLTEISSSLNLSGSYINNRRKTLF